jgi:hypothetical protein
LHKKIKNLFKKISNGKECSSVTGVNPEPAGIP